jgi:dihydrofolate synthase / folylpolyglutamate synthase
MVRWASIETGMGGRFDPTNVLNSVIAIITNIDYDHIPDLGRTLGEIAWHKAGIIKAGKPVVTGETKKEALEVIQAEARAKKAPIFVLGKDFQVENTRPDRNGIRMDVLTPFGGVKDLYMNLVGEYQALNAACAVMATLIAREMYGVNVTEQSISMAMQGIEIPGRMEKMQEEPIIHRR